MYKHKQYQEALDEVKDIYYDCDGFYGFESVKKCDCSLTETCFRREKNINLLQELIDRNKKLEKVIEFLKPHTHLASGLCEIKLVDEEVSKVTPKYHNGKEVYEPKYNEFYKLLNEVFEIKKKIKTEIINEYVECNYVQSYELYFCPSCGAQVEPVNERCSKCEQELDWSGEDES